MMFIPHIRTVFLIHTELCNINCKYCFNPKVGKKKLPFNYIYKFIKYKINKFGEDGNIIHFGGEPLLNKKVIIKTVKKFPYLKHQIVTNGTLLDKEFIDLMLRHNVEFEISIDGDYKTTIKNRLLSKEQYQNIVNSIKYIISRKGNEYVYSSTAVESQTYRNFFDSVRYLVDVIGMRNIGWNIIRCKNMKYNVNILSQELKKIYYYASEKKFFFGCVIPNCDSDYCPHRSHICALAPNGDILYEQNVYGLRLKNRKLYEKFVIGNIYNLDTLKMPPKISSKMCKDTNKGECNGRYCNFLVPENLLELSNKNKGCKVISKSLQKISHIIEPYYKQALQD